MGFLLTKYNMSSHKTTPGRQRQQAAKAEHGQELTTWERASSSLSPLRITIFYWTHQARLSFTRKTSPLPDPTPAVFHYFQTHIFPTIFRARQTNRFSETYLKHEKTVRYICLWWEIMIVIIWKLWISNKCISKSRCILILPAQPSVRGASQMIH